MNHLQHGAVLTELHYLPSISFFVGLKPFNKIVLEAHEHYPKQTYRNRCYIQTAHGPLPLSIPVRRSGTAKIMTKDVRVSYAEHWQNNHWRAIQSAYGKSPFFDFFANDYHDILYSKFEFLLDLNQTLLTKCLKFLGWHDKQIVRSDSYLKATGSQCVDQRGKISLSSAPPDDQQHTYARYQQVFGKNFVTNLSVIDLLFCEGANANAIIGQSSLQRR